MKGLDILYLCPFISLTLELIYAEIVNTAGLTVLSPE